MVPEDDPQFARFWDCYPKRVSKKDARRAWAKVNPSPALVDEMLVTLAWQSEIWAKENFTYAPYPASWLNGERWKDEPPPSGPGRRVMSEASDLVFKTLGVKL